MQLKKIYIFGGLFCYENLLLKRMKKLILLILMFVSLSGMCQVNSFMISNDKLIWENVFISSEANIPNTISRHVRLKITSSDGTIYKGTGTDIKNTCPGTSDFMKDGFSFSFNFEIELSEGKYRVTISNLVFSKSNKKTEAEKYFIENGLLKKDGKIEADLTCLDNYFNKIFTVTAIYKNRL